MSIALEFGLGSVQRLQARIERLGDTDRHALLTQIGAEIESQTRERLSSTKEAADNTPWAPWSLDYEARRRGGQSLLEGKGQLIDSITHDIQGDAVHVGSNLVYAAIHQFGGTPDMPPGPAGVPARPYLGFSDTNKADIETIVDRWLDKHLERA